MASVMLLLRHRVSLVGELLEANVVDAQVVAADVEGFLAMREVGHTLSKNQSYKVQLATKWRLLLAHHTDNAPSFP